jgi:hypothetical protein
MRPTRRLEAVAQVQEIAPTEHVVLGRVGIRRDRRGEDRRVLVAEILDAEVQRQAGKQPLIDP